MKLQKLIFILSISFLLSHEGHDHKSHSSTSGLIRGSIVDELTQQPKKYANISIVALGSEDIITGGISDEEGLFLIDKVPFGRYFLVVEYIGYEDKIIDGIAIHPPNNINNNIGKIEISPKMILMDGVSVVDRAAPIIEDIEKTTYPVAETARSEGGSADEVLEKLPSISLDIDGNINLRGNPNVTILIDGRKSQLDIKMLNSNMIEKVEVMTTPSAKYDADGMAGIINIVLSKNEFVGKSGSLSFNNSFFEGKKFDDNNEIVANEIVDGGQSLSGTFNYFKNEWNIFTAYGINFKKRQRTGEREIIFTDLDTGVSDAPIISNSIINMYPEKSNIKMGIEHYPNDRGLIAFDLTYINHEGIDTTYVRGTTDEQTMEDESGEDLNYGFGYFIDDKENNKNFSIEFDYDDHNSNETTVYDSYIDEIEDIGVDKIFSIDYSAPLILNGYDGKYEAGLKIIKGDDTHGGFVRSEDFNWTYDNLISAGYFTFDYNFSEQFGMQFGTRIESQTKESTIEYDSDFDCSTLVGTSNISGFCECEDSGIDGLWDTCTESLFKDLLEELETDAGGNLNYTYEHNRVYPSLYFMYDTQGKGNLKFALSRRIERPWHRALNPIPDLSEIENNWIRTGNPYLNPEDIYVSEIIYSNRTPIGFLKASFYVNQVTDKIDKDTDSYFDESSGETYIKFTTNNVSESNGRGVDLFLMTKPLPNVDLMFNGNYWHDELNGVQADQNGIESGFWGMINSTIRLQNDQEIGIYSHFSSPMKTATGEIDPMTRMDLTYKKKVNDKFNFKIKIKDLFNTSYFSIDTEEEINIDNDDAFDQLQQMSYTGRWNQRSISINFEYRFGAFQKKKYRRDDGGYKPEGGGMDIGF